MALDLPLVLIRAFVLFIKEVAIEALDGWPVTEKTDLKEASIAHLNAK